MHSKFLRCVLPFAIVAVAAAAPKSHTRVVYGEDDRLDEYEVTDEAWKAIGASTVAVMKTSSLTAGENSYSVDAVSMEVGMGLCDGERYLNQACPGFCSGFLIGTDLIATAGHCIRGQEDCNDASFVFDFVETDPDGSCNSDCTLEFPQENVYRCTEVINTVMDSTSINSVDFAVVRVDRPVENRTPLKLQSQKPAKGEGLLVIGHPSGMPRKYCTGKVSEVNEYNFVSNLDTFGGNSGSAVFSTDTNEVVGILVSGAQDYVESGEGCMMVNVCDEEPKLGEEDCAGETSTQVRFLHQYTVLAGDGCTTSEQCNGSPCVIVDDGFNYCNCSAPGSAHDCSSVCDSDEMCNGNGECTEPWKCDCDIGYYADLCSAYVPGTASSTESDTSACLVSDDVAMDLCGWDEDDIEALLVQGVNCEKLSENECLNTEEVPCEWDSNQCSINVQFWEAKCHNGTDAFNELLNLMGVCMNVTGGEDACDSTEGCAYYATAMDTIEVSDEDDDDDNTGVIIGAVVGSVAGVAVVAGSVFYIRRRRAGPGVDSSQLI